MLWKFTFTTLGDLPRMLLFFIMQVRNCVMGATPMLNNSIISSHKCHVKTPSVRQNVKSRQTATPNVWHKWFYKRVQNQR